MEVSALPTWPHYRECCIAEVVILPTWLCCRGGCIAEAYTRWDPYPQILQYADLACAVPTFICSDVALVTSRQGRVSSKCIPHMLVY